MLKTYVYHWQHLKGVYGSGVRQAEFESRLDFLEALNRWNRSLRWKYWEEEGDNA
jgi:hypothetical protein